MQGPTKQLKVVLCQLGPKLHKKSYNIAQSDALLKHYTKDDNIDLIIFPQLSFTGYNFKNKQDAQPLAVSVGQGEQFHFACQLAIKLHCYIIFGYIELSQTQPQHLYNSAALINRDGKTIFNTRKTFLYFCDDFWCKEGDGFKTVTILNTKGQPFKCGVGICMDINPKGYIQFGKKQFANFLKTNKCQIIIFPTNWVDNQPNVNTLESSNIIYNYWLDRLSPLNNTHQIYFLAVDRVGAQYSYYDKQQITFLGSSCIISLNPHQLEAYTDKKLLACVQHVCTLPAAV